MAPTGVDVINTRRSIALVPEATGTRPFPTPGPSAKPPDPATRPILKSGDVRIDRRATIASPPPCPLLT